MQSEKDMEQFVEQRLEEQYDENEIQVLEGLEEIGRASCRERVY